MKVLVTGASGFVGQWLCRDLIKRGFEVRALVRELRPAGLNHDAPAGDFVIGDILEPSTLKSALKGIEIVFHLAGFIGYKKSDRAKLEQVNVNGTANVISACKVSGCRRLVHFSSVATVGASFNGHEPLNENSPYNLADLNLGYFETKRRAENLVIAACRSGEIDAVILNPSNIYGPGDAQKGSRSTQLEVARGKFPFYTSGGVSIVHIEDVVAATIRASEVGKNGERYILSGENIAIKKLFQMIAEAAGVKPPGMYLPNLAVLLLANLSEVFESIGRKGLVSSESARASILYHWFDHAKATKELNFHPRPAREAINESVKWMRNQGLLN